MGNVVDLKSRKNNLTNKEENFCQLFVFGINPKDNKPYSQSEAYREAYNSNKATPKSINELSSRLMKKVKIRSRVDALRHQFDSKKQASALNKRSWVESELVKIVSNIEENSSSRVRAIEIIAKLNHLLTDKVIEVKESSSHELKEQLANRLDELLGKSA